MEMKYNIFLQKKYHEQLEILSNQISFRTRNGIFALLASLSPHHEPGIVTFVEFVFWRESIIACLLDIVSGIEIIDTFAFSYFTCGPGKEILPAILIFTL